MKNRLYRFDASFDQPGLSYTATLTTSNLEGMKALRNITLQNYRGKSIQLGGFDKLSETQKAAANEVLRILVGIRFDGVGYDGTTRKFHLKLKKNEDEVLGMYIDRIICVTTRLLPKVEGLLAYDDSDLGREKGYVMYSETVPNWGHRIGYKVPFNMMAYSARIAKETEADRTVADTKTHVAEETFKQEEIDTRVQKENLKQTESKLTRWLLIGGVAAVAAIIVAVIILVSNKK